MLYTWMYRNGGGYNLNTYMTYMYTSIYVLSQGKCIYPIPLYWLVIEGIPRADYKNAYNQGYIII